MMHWESIEDTTREVGRLYAKLRRVRLLMGITIGVLLTTAVVTAVFLIVLCVVGPVAGDRGRSEQLAPVPKGPAALRESMGPKGTGLRGSARVTGCATGSSAEIRSGRKDDVGHRLASRLVSFTRRLPARLGEFVWPRIARPWTWDIAVGDPHYRRFLAALATHESFDGSFGKLVGDDGKSLGPYHIGGKYWADGCAELGLALPWWPCALFACYSERVITAYFGRYETAALLCGDWEVLARLHNGGPFSRKGPEDPKTLAYWKKIEAIMAIDDPTAQEPDQGRRWHGGMRPAHPPPAHRFRRRVGARGAMWMAEAKEFYWEAATTLFVDREYD